MGGLIFWTLLKQKEKSLCFSVLICVPKKKGEEDTDAHRLAQIKKEKNLCFSVLIRVPKKKGEQDTDAHRLTQIKN